MHEQGGATVEFDYLREKRRAVDYLSDSLGRGTLVLVLGAGASVGVGLPDWVTLVGNMAQRAGIAADALTGHNVPAEELQLLADKILREFCKNDERQFAGLVRTCLYDGVELSNRLLRSDLLTAVGALMMGSRRGSVRRVLTFNFDSIIEWYMFLHGFVPRVVLQPPELEGAEDVRIYHPHGFLPHPELKMKASDFVVLGLRATNLRLGKGGDPWFELLRHLLRTGVGLFVGMSPRSFRDRALAPLLAAVGEELKAERPTAFWVLLASERSEASADEFLADNVVPLSCCGNKEDVPPFLLEICQKAASQVTGVAI